jgi:ATP-dependent RNA helicase DDX21
MKSSRAYWGKNLVEIRRERKGRTTTICNLMERLGKRARESNINLVDSEPETTKKVRIGVTGTRKKSQELEVKHQAALSAGKNLGPNGTMLEDATREAGDFENFRISPKTITVLNKKGISYLFPIQAKTFDAAYDGSDIVGRDRTGSGKTLAYALPIIERFRADGVFSRSDGLPKLLVLVPTRELAMQVTREINEIKHAPNEYRVLATYGGTDIREQMHTIRNGIEIVIAAPGRIWDLIERNAINLTGLRTLILDETDQMLDIGFQEPIEKIIQFIVKQLPNNRKLQFLLFSATIPKWVREIADHFLAADAKTIDLIKNSDIKTSVGVEHLALCIPLSQQKVETISDIVTVYGGQHSRTIIFTETKQEANDVMLKGNLKTEAQVLHGDIVQKQREITFQGFRDGQFKCLIATNVAARGLDIPQVDLIVQLGVPKDVDTYIHRAGRTARAGKSGVCITIYTKKNQLLLDRIEKYAKIKFKKIGVPQPDEIVKAAARDIACSFTNVHSDVLEPFAETAKDLIDKFGIEESLCRALAIISGHTTKIQQRSLLWAVEGYITVIMRVKTEVTSISYIWSILRRHFPQSVVDGVKGVKLLKDRQGAAFDVPESMKSDLFESTLTGGNNKTFSIEFPSELPELAEDERDRMQAPSGRGGYGRGGYGDRGNYGRSNSAGNYGRNGYGDGNSGSRGGYGGNRGGSGDGMNTRRSYGEKPNHNKLFVGNLDYNTDDQSLKNAFENQGFGVVDGFTIKDQATKKSRGFGYVIFRSPEDYTRALQMGGIVVDGRQTRVNAATNSN